MSENRITIQICGAHEDKGKVRLPDLLGELYTISKILRRIDRLQSGGEEASMYFRIADLRYSSPASIEIEAVPIKRKVDLTKVVVQRFVSAANDIHRASAPDDFDYELLAEYKNIGRTLKEQHVSELQIKSNGGVLHLKESLRESVNKILMGDEVSHGSMSGILEWLNIHNKANKFHIYPVAGPEKVECKFTEDLFDLATNSVNKYVRVEGNVKYHKRARFPYAVDVETMEVFPDESELPTFWDVRGLAPDATGELSTDDFLRQIRSSG